VNLGGDLAVLPFFLLVVFAFRYGFHCMGRKGAGEGVFVALTRSPQTKWFQPRPRPPYSVTTLPLVLSERRDCWVYHPLLRLTGARYGSAALYS
jgi:hypothetical protein